MTRKSKAPEASIDVTVSETGQGWETVTATATYGDATVTQTAKAARGDIAATKAKLQRHMEKRLAEMRGSDAPEA